MPSFGNAPPMHPQWRLAGLVGTSRGYRRLCAVFGFYPIFHRSGTRTFTDVAKYGLIGDRHG